MKKLSIFLMTFYAASTICSSWWPWGGSYTSADQAKARDEAIKGRAKKAKLSPSVFDQDLPTSPNFEREAILEQEVEKLMDEWGSLRPDKISDKYQLTPDEISELLRSNNPEFLERTVWLYDQPFTVRQLLGELSHQTAEYTPDVLTKITENYYVNKAAERYKEMKDVTLIQARVALLNVLRSIADYTSQKAREMEDVVAEEIE